MTHYINDEELTLVRINEIIDNNHKLALSDGAIQRIVRCREYLDHKMDTQKAPIYGVTTGFGSLCDISVSREELSQLQYNLVVSHACGTGDEVEELIIRLILLLKIQSLSYGHSGVQLCTVERLIAMYNEGVYPIVYELGSLGASGDLAPLAHLSLPLLGLGEVRYKGEKFPSATINEKFGWQPITLQSKEGLALLNGTQFMSAHAVYATVVGNRLTRAADTIAAISLEAFDGRKEPFSKEVHQLRAHPGQIHTAEKIRTLLEGSELIDQPKVHVQDPYSFRCVPQVHGASKDTVSHVERVVSIEINSVTDNPNVFVEEDMVISAGNFHGQPLALVMDFMAIAVSELASISGQRTYQLISGKRGLPKLLVANPGLNSGFMIPQYAAASIVSQNKQLSTPASVDSIESSQGQEDHVSMGANAATKLRRVMNNTEKVLGIELFNAMQALEFRRPMKSSSVIEELFEEYRKVVPFIENDTVMYPHIEASVKFVREKM